jgi:curved DNA-binding protein CbpA
MFKLLQLLACTRPAGMLMSLLLQVQQAYETLTDPDKRQQYEAGGGWGSSGGSNYFHQQGRGHRHHFQHVGTTVLGSSCLWNSLALWNCMLSAQTTILLSMICRASHTHD